MRVAGDRNRVQDRRHHGAVVALVEPFVREVRCKKRVDEVRGGAAARAVNHFNGAAAEVGLANVAGFDGHL